MPPLSKLFGPGLQSLLRGLVLLVLAGLTPAWAQERPSDIPIASFFKQPALRAPSLSPDGSKLAMLMPGPNGRNVLAIADVATPSRRVGVATFDDADIASFNWVNDKRLVLQLTDHQSPLGEQHDGGLYGVDADGGDFVFLVGRGRKFESEGHAAIRPLRWNHVLIGVPQDDSDDVLGRVNTYGVHRRSARS